LGSYDPQIWDSSSLVHVHVSLRQGLVFAGLLSGLGLFPTLGKPLALLPLTLGAQPVAQAKELAMETAVGVFASRERAEAAMKQLLDHQVPEERIIYLTRSETDAAGMEKHCSGLVDRGVEGSTYHSQDLTTSLIAVPGVGSVFALGLEAAALFGEYPRVAGEVGSVSPGAGPTSDSANDTGFFRDVLNDGHSVIVVRTNSSQIASTACEILDKLGLSMPKRPAPRSAVRMRESNGAAIADLSGKIALAEGTGLLRATVRNFIEQGYTRILLNLEQVDFIDSAGLGELVRTQTTLRGCGGQLKLVNPNRNVHHLLRITKLDRIFDIAADEFSALSSLRQGPAKSPN
jgi:anti-sigma B factor antagonist